jgi:topoisomerase-4 subunit A
LPTQIKELREKFGKKTPLGKRRTDFAEAPEHDEAAIEEAMVVREPITVVLSDKGWVRALRGHVEDLANVAIQAGRQTEALVLRRDDLEAHDVRPPTGASTRWKLQAAGRARPRRAGAAVHRSRAGRRHRHDVSLSGRRKFIVASHQGRGFVVPRTSASARRARASRCST